MLKGIPAQLSPELVKVLMEMGHGDELVLGDANFPAHSCHHRVIRCDGLGIPELMRGILQLFPLDSYADWQVGLMQTVANDPRPPIWDTYTEMAGQQMPDFKINYFERFEFYRHVPQCYAVVLTGETALYGNIILKKGVIV